MSILIEKLWMEKKEFVSAKELKEYCKALKMDHESVIHYFIKRKHLVRIFRGIFYVKSLEEFKLGKSKYNHLELVSKGLELKGVKNWYFGLHSALKLNNMTHEYFAVEEVISDSLFRAKPISIAGYKFRFVKISPSLLDFGIKKDSSAMLRYSDPEKTVLDLIYLSRQDGIPVDRIVMDISDWSKNISKDKLKKYSKNYPKTIVEVVERLIR
ncbi:MAG: type IV toxin-antitoxin system AbiEi family antitoxin domain-containing protein [Nitrosotalea sp.]